MKPIVADVKLVARCGLYCGACGAYRRGRCAGCADGPKFACCPVRKCCVDNNYASCADCREFANPRDCKKFNNFISRLFGLIFRSDRAACIEQIRVKGPQGHADIMAMNQTQSIRRGRRTVG
jgi:hypothetical protein